MDAETDVLVVEIGTDRGRRPSGRQDRAGRVNIGLAYATFGTLVGHILRHEYFGGQEVLDPGAYGESEFRISEGRSSV
ncbi:MAG: hypothetical protein ICV69_13730 [Thermoleophilaceae bacterium]|nr:hypothetical protein [Thermoleophilaceae bacterium]